MAEKNVNYLTLIPQIPSELRWTNDENNIVTLEIDNKGIFNKIAQLIFKKPKISYIHLDELGSFVWQQIDGKRNVDDISVLVKERFGETAEPLYQKLVKYLEILKSYHFIILK